MNARNAARFSAGSLILLLSLPAALASAKTPLAHVKITTVRSYDGQAPLPVPQRVVVYDLAISPEVVKTDHMPGVRQRLEGNSKDSVAAQVQSEITKDLIEELTKRLKASGIAVEKGDPATEPPGTALTIRGTITKADEGHRMRRGTVGLGAGASDVETDCEISTESAGNTLLVSEVKTVSKSSKKPGAAVTMGAGAAPAVAAGVAGATAHKSTVQGDSARTGIALAKHIADLMNTHGWISSDGAQPTGSSASTDK